MKFNYCKQEPLNEDKFGEESNKLCSDLVEDTYLNYNQEEGG